MNSLFKKNGNASWTKARRRVAAGLCVATILCVAVPTSWPQEKKKSAAKNAVLELGAKPEAKTGGESGRSNGLTLTGQLSEDSAGPRGIIRFWLTIENNTDRILDAVQLQDPAIPGFHLQRICWPIDADKPCLEIPERPSDGENTAAKGSPGVLYALADHLQPQQALTIEGDLEATDSAAKQNAVATVIWNVGGLPSGKAVTLGEVESINGLRAFALKLIHGWEWSFPLATVIAGVLYDQWKRKKREKTKAKEAKAKADAHRDEETRKTEERRREQSRDQQNRTWNLMLPRSQRAALKFYTPLAAAAQSAREQLRKYCSSQAAADLPATCHEILLFHWRLRLAIDKIGGYYFKNRDAEQLADLIYRKHRCLLGLDNAHTRALLAKAVDCITPATTIADFLAEQKKSGSATEKFWKYFEIWALTDLDGTDSAVLDAEILDAYAALLEYESNRPSLHWYGRLDPISFTIPEARNVMEEWEAWKGEDRLNLRDEQVAKIEKMAHDYLAEVEKPAVVS